MWAFTACICNKYWIFTNWLLKWNCNPVLFACWIILHAFLSPLDFSSIFTSLRNTTSVKQFRSISGLNILSNLIWVQSVRKIYQQTTKVVNGSERNKAQVMTVCFDLWWIKGNIFASRWNRLICSYFGSVNPDKMMNNAAFHQGQHCSSR